MISQDTLIARPPGEVVISANRFNSTRINTPDANIRGDIYLYRNELYDLVVRKRLENNVIEGYKIYQKENSERAYIQGVETDWNFDINSSLGINGSFTWTYGQNITNDEPVRRIPLP